MGVGGAGCQSTSGRVAFRGGMAYWPENSKSAIEESVARDWSAVSFDVFLTQDRVPVLNALPKLDSALCSTIGKRPLPDDVWLLNVTADVLRAGYLCGISEDPRTPNAKVVGDAVATLDELFEQMGDDDTRTLHLQIAFEPNVSHDPAVFAAEVLGRAEMRGVRAPMVVVSPFPEVLQAFVDDPRFDAVPVQTTLVWPRLPPVSGSGAAQLTYGLGALNGVVDPVSVVQMVPVDGIRLHPNLATASDVRRLRAHTAYIEVGPVFSAADARAFARWDVDAVVAADPELR